MKTGFDNEKYLRIQSEQIKKRIAQFGDKLYLEFGGKLFDDNHASRVLPGFQPDSKLQMLLQLKDEAEVLMVISAIDIEKNKVRGDLGITYDEDVLRLRSEFEQLKAQYDKEMPAKKAAQEAQRAAADKLAADIDPTLMEHYKRIKKHITPPLSRLVNGQCSGCNTSLLSAVLHRVRNASEEIVECESCGRMIIRM